MNKTCIITALAAAALLASCGDEKDPVATQTAQYVTYNLYTPLNDSETASVTPAVYTVKYDLINSEILVSADQLIWDNASHTLKSGPGRYTQSYYTDGGTAITFKGIDATVSANPPQETKLSGVITDRMYYTNAVAPGISGSWDYMNVPIIALNWTVPGRFLVRTFNREAYAAGVTTTSFSMGGQQQSYENSETMYRWVIDVDKKTADVVIYKAKFAESMPAIAGIVLRGLKVEWTRDGYAISGAGIVPEIIEGSSTTPNQSYTFDSFVLSTAGEQLTEFTADYKVAGRFEGRFRGWVSPTFQPVKN